MTEKRQFRHLGGARGDQGCAGDGSVLQEAQLRVPTILAGIGAAARSAFDASWRLRASDDVRRHSWRVLPLSPRRREHSAGVSPISQASHSDFFSNARHACPCARGAQLRLLPRLCSRRFWPAKPQGGDILVSAQTGSGKTVAYGLAIASTILGDAGEWPEARAPVALIVAPTRELALQVERELELALQACTARIVVLRRRHGRAPRTPQALGGRSYRRRARLAACAITSSAAD